MRVCGCGLWSLILISGSGDEKCRGLLGFEERNTARTHTALAPGACDASYRFSVGLLKKHRLKVSLTILTFSILRKHAMSQIRMNPFENTLINLSFPAFLFWKGCSFPSTFCHVSPFDLNSATPFQPLGMKAATPSTSSYEAGDHKQSSRIFCVGTARCCI